jgi:hypothetical protein
VHGDYDRKLVFKDRDLEKLLKNEVMALREILKFDAGNTKIFVDDLEREKAKKASTNEANPGMPAPVEPVQEF